ncbi:hypothetical protein LWI28_014308 [Acer negundo]|uniref:Uncharacterized protein n=1 Tax=Acer negundo TaxID=4023 RepID=A0AAD5J9J5_ACENE|nr:hypothetical protein LWI28_014308 [Acer negundo]
MIKRNQAQSSAKAEYIVAAAAPKQAKWIKKVSTDLNYVIKKPTGLWCNNPAFSIAKNHVQHGKTKHNNVKFHAIREGNKNGVAGTSKLGLDGSNNVSDNRNSDVKSGVSGNANAHGSIRYGSDGFNRKMSVEYSEGKHGKKDSLKSGRGNKSADGSNIHVGSNSTSSRFEILNEEVEANIIEETLNPINNTMVKGTLAEITNINRKLIAKSGKGIKKDQYSPILEKKSEGHESENVLRLLHKDVHEFEEKNGAWVDGDLIRGNQINSEMNIDNRFVAVASNLEEAMAAITE